MSACWVFQDDHQLKKHGPDKASWYVGWTDPEGKRRCKSCGAGTAGKKTAFRLRDKIAGELREGTYKRSIDKKTWEEFRGEYESKILAGVCVATRQVAEAAFQHFERIIKPRKMKSVKTQTIDDYRAKQRARAEERRPRVSGHD